ncbi:MAG: Holliday junction resolvase RuvX [Bacteroidota bacterium]
MGRILAIDYGSKKCGLAATDPLRIVVTALQTVRTDDLLDWLSMYLAGEQVDIIVIGEPVHKDGQPTFLHEQIVGLERKIRKRYPAIELARQDEFYTSMRAKQSIIDSGHGRKKRRDKEMVDRVAAAIILEDFLDSQT